MEWKIFFIQGGHDLKVDAPEWHFQNLKEFFHLKPILWKFQSSNQLKKITMSSKLYSSYAHYKLSAIQF